MTEDEIKELKAQKEIYRELLRGLNLKLQYAKAALKDLEARWEEVDKEYEAIDRKIAMATKLIVLPTRGVAPKKEMTPSQAADLLALLSANVEPIKEEEDPTKILDEIDEILLEEEVS